MTLLEMFEIIQPNSKFAKRVKAAALVAAASVEWVAVDYDSADPAEKASRLVMGGGDLTKILLRCVAAAKELKLPMRGTDDVEVDDGALAGLVESLLIASIGT